MTTFHYSAVDARGQSVQGAIQVADQTEAIKRIKEMGFFPVKISAAPSRPADRAHRHTERLGFKSRLLSHVVPRPQIPSPSTPKAFGAHGERARVRGGKAHGLRTTSRHRIKPKRLALFTRQLATLLEAGMPLLRGLRLLQEQETHPPLKKILGDLAFSIEGGSTFSEALAQHPRTFDHLFLNMVKAGELGGMLELTLKRLADFMEKSGRIKNKVTAAMAYPACILTVAVGVMALLMVYVIPKFKEIFADLTGGQQLPAFTRFVFGVSEVVQHHFLLGVVLGVIAYALFLVAIATRPGRSLFDLFKLKMPLFGPLFRKVAIARFTRTLGTLVSSGVPILQALSIVKEATGNVVMGRLVARVHTNVEQGESIVGPLRDSGIFPRMVAGLVDVGEQTGALPEMLNRIADNYDEEVDNSVAALTSLMEPLLIVTLAVIVGSIVVAVFLPLVGIDPTGTPQNPSL